MHENMVLYFSKNPHFLCVINDLGSIRGMKNGRPLSINLKLIFLDSVKDTSS